MEHVLLGLGPRFPVITEGSDTRDISLLVSGQPFGSVLVYGGEESWLCLHTPGCGLHSWSQTIGASPGLPSGCHDARLSLSQSQEDTMALAVAGVTARCWPRSRP